MNQGRARKAVSLIKYVKYNNKNNYNTYGTQIVNSYSIKTRKKMTIKRCRCCKNCFNKINFEVCPICYPIIKILISDILINAMITYELRSRNLIIVEKQLLILRHLDLNYIDFKKIIISHDNCIIHDVNGRFVISKGMNHVKHFITGSYCICSNCCRVIKFESFNLNDILYYFENSIYCGFCVNISKNKGIWKEIKNEYINKLLLLKFIFKEVIELSYFITSLILK